MDKPKNPDCPTFLGNVARLVDGRMKPEEEQHFLTSIEDNMECLHKLELEQSYKDFLSKKLERKCCSDNLIQCIKDKVAEVESRTQQ